ncbi:YqiJ family protein [Francisella philomiragia]|uniref:YqiJ family protein n=1 Tax=Francisella philomiragia TaxID=28110 RepID=UPI00190540DE|nr:YqiJ family protein [Francisella philomiragia]MBK2267823.1 YqiJ family protein [Francisella philomiragia]MBK2279077.1 YqiJ family protein [Francisella philomiragia]MBK2287134.1 YqiJ family protein [Francisella philomiragia]MBK2288909.1 YqiJ family protein [Francisella philomiragia]MBK2290627.1 YqiJ family protein [Francisella philomiragia]
MDSTFLLASQNTPFSVTLLVLIIISSIEIIGTIFGMGLSHLCEMVFPSVDMPDHLPDLGSNHSFFGSIYSWLRVGNVPIIILLIAFLACFAVCGFILQYILFSSIGWLMPASLASLVTFIISIPMMRYLAYGISKVMPKDETNVVSEASFVGKVAEIVLGEANKNDPTQAKLIDDFGTDHYILIEPDNDNVTFKKGDKIIVVRFENKKYYGIKNTYKSLV